MRIFVDEAGITGGASNTYLKMPELGKFTCKEHWKQTQILDVQVAFKGITKKVMASNLFGH